MKTIFWAGLCISKKKLYNDRTILPVYHALSQLEQYVSDPLESLVVVALVRLVQPVQDLILNEVLYLGVDAHPNNNKLRGNSGVDEPE